VDEVGAAAGLAVAVEAVAGEAAGAEEAVAGAAGAGEADVDVDVDEADGAAGVDVGADTDGVNDGLRLLFTADVSATVVPSVSAVSALSAGLVVSTCLPGSAVRTVVRAFTFPTVSAGSGAAVADPLSAAASATVADSPAAASPLAPPSRWLEAERDDPALVRDDDMMPLSTTASVAFPSGSASRPRGAMMSDG